MCDLLRCNKKLEENIIESLKCAVASLHKIIPYGLHQVKKCLLTSQKHTYIILTPRKPHFYIVKLGYIGVYIIFLISAQKHRLWVLINIDCGYSRVPTIYVLSRNMKKYQNFLSDNFPFWIVKFSIYLNRHVFVRTPAECADSAHPAHAQGLIRAFAFRSYIL